MTNKEQTNFDPADFETLTRALCSWFVRRDGKYYSVNRTTTKMSKDDVIYVALGRFRDEFGEIELSDELLRAVFNKAIMEKHGEPGMAIPVWNGRELCAPEIHAVTVPEDGAVAVNSWRHPEYRSIEEVQPTLGVAGEFIDVLFSREPEKEMFLNWLACLSGSNLRIAGTI